MDIKNILKLITPPILLSFAKSIRNSVLKYIPEYEFITEDWKLAENLTKIKGWNQVSILNAYKKNWSNFLINLDNDHIFRISPESISQDCFDLVYHNTLLIFAYSITAATQKKSSLRMLDWGGGIGHYYLIAKSLLPNIAIDYHCKDVPVLANYGQTLFPEAKFLSDESYIFDQFDFILASASLHYVEDWKRLLDTFVECSNGYILLTRLPITLEKPFVYIQRPYKYGYQTEYISWAINRNELIDYCQKIGFHFIREFITGERPDIKNAPSFCEYRAYLFSNLKNE
jgi:putative methyltransferase (TIGR04325 family)